MESANYRDCTDYSYTAPANLAPVVKQMAHSEHNNLEGHSPMASELAHRDARTYRIPRNHWSQDTKYASIRETDSVYE